MTSTTRLKQSEVSVIRERLIVQQGGRCALCQLPITKPVLDHDHSTGAVRGALHNGCNALLGKLENNYRRYGVVNLAAFAHGVTAYLQRHATNQTGYLHPTHRSEDEKRERRNAKARATRAAKSAGL
jgi:hypothetical protein